ncbi:hypothetical protein [uncultured Thiodictyon sp.]|jgi:hypothetical protein|uniref:hypothetical protein n=1 Tax=uncultured Thiodictyon sp. TaxID=1846217 RepID=UPI0025DCF7DA|nr:hypothetical protein [uncultured Thiodictyon sp.]
MKVPRGSGFSRDEATSGWRQSLCQLHPQVRQLLFDLSARPCLGVGALGLRLGAPLGVTSGLCLGLRTLLGIASAPGIARRVLRML